MNGRYKTTKKKFIIPKDFQEKLIIDTSEMKIVLFNGEKIDPVGKYAVFTNKGVVLQSGCIQYDGTYISKNENIPEGPIRTFKEVFTFPNDYSRALNTFEDIFCHTLSQDDAHKTWDTIHKKVLLSTKGKDLIDRKDFKIHCIVNLKMGQYGIYKGDTKDRLGYKGVIYLSKDNRLTLITNSKKIELN